MEAYYNLPHVGYSVYGYHWPYLQTRYTHYYGKREAEAEPEADAEAYYRGFGFDQTAYLLGHIPVIFLMDQAQTDEMMDTSYPSDYNNQQSPSQPQASLNNPEKVSYFNNGVRQLIILESTPDQSYMNKEEYAMNQLSSGFKNPSSGYQNPSSGYPNPSNGFQNPSSGYQNPSSGYKNPSSGYQNPSSGYQNPSNGYQNPSSGYQNPSNGYQNPSSGYQNPSNGYPTQSGRFEYSFNQQEKLPQLPGDDFYRNDYNGNSGFINQNQPQLLGGNFARGQISNEDQSYYGAADANRYTTVNIYTHQFPNNPNQHFNPNQNKAYSSVGFNPTETKNDSSDKKLGFTSLVDLRSNEEKSRPTAYNRPAQRQNSKANKPRGFSDEESSPIAFKRQKGLSIKPRKDFQSNKPRGNSAKESKPKDQKTPSS